jgi:hypothetical protein
MSHSMEETKRQALLAAGFTDDVIQLETTASRRVAGFVIAERFDGMAQLD